jgi:predicted adenine nucleotide alpha hydrolase (AANH) superfamily ATPase
MKKVLLHVCCGICESYPIQKLKEDGYAVACLFYNPNIEPREEYDRRLAVARSAAELLEVEFMEGPYDNAAWREAAKGLEQEPEGGKRCEVCFRLRLDFASKKARDLGIECIASTLSVSPHKAVTVINAVGAATSAGSFLSYDFKKQDGFKKTQIFAREHQLYRQNYCGCLFSKKV